MLKAMLASLVVAGTMLATSQLAAADPVLPPPEPGYGCELNCKWYVTYDGSGNPNGGFWVCPGEEMECVQ